MANAYELLKEKGISDTRKQFLKLVQAQDKEIDRLMIDTSKQVGGYMAKSTNRNGELDNKKFGKYMKYIFAFWALNFTNILISTNQKATEISTQEALNDALVLGDDGINSLILNRGKELSKGIEKTLLTRKIFKDEVTLTWRIKTIEKSYMKTVQDIVKHGANEGWSAFQVAQQIDNVIRPKGFRKWVSPFDWFRSVRKGMVTGRRAGSVSYNSYRIARTELNETYRRNTVLVHEGQPYIEGFRWNLSPAHPELDICDDFAGKIFEGYADIPETHPNCYCYITPVMIDPEAE